MKIKTISWYQTKDREDDNKDVTFIVVTIESFHGYSNGGYSTTPYLLKYDEKGNSLFLIENDREEEIILNGHYDEIGNPFSEETAKELYEYVVSIF